MPVLPAAPASQHPTALPSRCPRHGGLRFGVNLKYPRSPESCNSPCEVRTLSAAVIKSAPAQTPSPWHLMEANVIKVLSLGMGETGEFAKGDVGAEISS